jgi:hypothetical protein
MTTSGDQHSPSRRERKPLPHCLTRLLQVSPVGPTVGSPSSSGSGHYVDVLAATWLELDRLAGLTDAMAQSARRTRPRR